MAVVFCHMHLVFGEPGGDFLLWGGMGVQVFFVISGFVIPYSLYKAKYELSDYPNYLLKRFLRLYPVFLVALALTAVLSYASAEIRHTVCPITWGRLVQNVFTLTRIPDENIVFWTLRIEAEYYLAIGLLFPLLRTKSELVFITVTGVVLAVSDHYSWGPVRIFGHTAYFVMGIAVYRYLTGIGGRTSTLLQLAALALYQFDANNLPYGGMPAVVALGTALMIAFWRPQIGPVFAYLGTISYSVYAIHQPVGNKFDNLFLRYAKTTPARVLVLAGAVTLAMAAGIGLYYLIERPSIRWTSAVKYRSSARKKLPGAPAPARTW